MKVLQVGEIVEISNIFLQCRDSQDFSCSDCYWFVENHCNDTFNFCGACSSDARPDGKDVIFVKVGDV